MRGNAHRIGYMCHRMFQCGFIVGLTALLLTMAETTASGGAACPDLGNHFAAPASEMAQIIADWLERQGCTVHQDSPEAGQFHLSARQQREHWEITIRPHSTLASVVTVVYDGTRSQLEACHQLRKYVDGYLQNPASAPSPPAYDPQERIPTSVLEKIEAVVCIRTRSAKDEVQFSGFVVDPNGLVLCTAHNLNDHQRVMVTFQDGVERTGTITRRDPDRDLALVACSASGLAFVSLSSSRNRLAMGERLFSIGCPNNLEGTLSPGIVNSPPRLLRHQPLWQVEMRVYPGSSGSPVFDDQGRLVAMVKGRYRGTTTVGFLIPVETILSFLKDTIGS